MRRCVVCKKKIVGVHVALIHVIDRRVWICTPCIKLIIKYVVDRLLSEVDIGHSDDKS